jgi:2-desacetyl-2-hydroxyethyl bacteriochlorophyllide A dehydrogenase
MAKKMKAAFFEKPENLTVREFDIPEVGPSDILVRVRACAICGSDLHSYKDGSWITPGQIMGHEFSGDVVKVGKEVKGISEGDRITAHPMTYCYSCPMCLEGYYYLCFNKFNQGIAYGLPGAFAEYVRVPNAKLDHTVYKLPDEISYDEGALIEPLSTSIHAVQLGTPRIAIDNVVVFGAGTIGNFVIQTLRNANPYTIICCEVSKKRGEFARKMGADYVINPRKDNFSDFIQSLGKNFCQSYPRWVDLVFECSGSSIALEQALSVIEPSGRIILVALGPKTSIDITFLVQNQIKLQGAFCYLDEFKQAIELVRNKKVDAHSLISHRYPLKEITEAFETQLDKEKSIKVVINP